METTDIEQELLGLQGDLMRFALRLTGDEDGAMDLLQETNLKVLVGHRKFVQGTCFRAWVFAIMHNSFRTLCRRENMRSVVENLYCIAPSGAGSEESLPCDYPGFAADIECAMASLPACYRYVIEEFLVGSKYCDIAVRLSLPIGTVKSRINIGRIYLRRFLGGYRC